MLLQAVTKSSENRLPTVPRHTSIPCADTASSTESMPSSPKLADNFMTMKHDHRELLGYALTKSDFKKQEAISKQRTTVLKAVSQVRMQPVAKRVK